MMEINVRTYMEEDETRWDDFVFNKSINGTFLQTRNFLNYHPAGRFCDSSLIIEAGEDIVAVIPACIEPERKKTFYSHMGSTFGGIVISSDINTIARLDHCLKKIEDFLTDEDFTHVVLKMTPKIFSKPKYDEKLDYLFYQYGYDEQKELSAYIELGDLEETDILSTFASNKRRGCRKAIKNNLEFYELFSHKELELFYNVLKMNLERHGKTPVHTLEELYDLKENRLQDKIKFMGVFWGEELVAGAMLFLFGTELCHTQYIASHPDHLDLYSTNYLYYKIISWAKNEHFNRLSWGISTENQGHDLNLSLASFKEGFGSRYSINSTYTKELQR